MSNFPMNTKDVNSNFLSELSNLSSILTQLDVKLSTRASESTLADIKTAVQIIDNFISGTKGLVTEDNSSAILTATNAVRGAGANVKALYDIWLKLENLTTGDNELSLGVDVGGVLAALAGIAVGGVTAVATTLLRSDGSSIDNERLVYPENLFLRYTPTVATGFVTFVNSVIDADQDVYLHYVSFSLNDTVDMFTAGGHLVGYQIFHNTVITKADQFTQAQGLRSPQIGASYYVQKTFEFPTYHRVPANTTLRIDLLLVTASTPVNIYCNLEYHKIPPS